MVFATLFLIVFFSANIIYCSYKEWDGAAIGFGTFCIPMLILFIVIVFHTLGIN